MPRKTQRIDLLTPPQQSILDSCVQKLSVFIDRENKSLRNTFSTYKSVLTRFIIYCFLDEGVDPRYAGAQVVASFLIAMIDADAITNRTYDNYWSALKYCVEHDILHFDWNRVIVPYRRFKMIMGYCPRKEAVVQLIQSVKDPKENMMLTLIFACGLRLYEVCTLQYVNVIRDDRRLHIIDSKGHIDRFIEIPEKIYHQLVDYIASIYTTKAEREAIPGESYLFPSINDPSLPYNEDTFSMHIRDYNIALWGKVFVTAHCIRRAFATFSIIENNLTLTELRIILGHLNDETTQLYIQYGLTLYAPRHKNVTDPYDLRPHR